VDPVRGPGTADEEELEREYAAALIRAARVEAQLTELGFAFAEANVGGLVLKGAALQVRFRGYALPRPLSDVDLVVRREEATAAGRVLERLGYAHDPWNGPEDALLQLQAGPGLGFHREGALPVDLQTWFPGLPRDPRIGDEIWSQAVAFGGDLMGRCGILLLQPMHEFLMGAAHLSVHLRPPLTMSPKWIGDLLLLVHANATAEKPVLLPRLAGSTLEEKLAGARLEELIWPYRTPAVEDEGRFWRWREVWETAERWGILKEVGDVCATLNAHWGVEIPGVPAEAEALELERLAGPEEGYGALSRAAVPAAYLERVVRMRELPGWGARLRYLWLIIPTSEGLRRRYGLPPSAFLLPWYGRYIFERAGRLMGGAGLRLWLAMGGRRRR